MKTRRRKSPAAALAFTAPPGAEETEPSALDRHFARLMCELNGAPAADLEAAAQMASAWRSAGHICVQISDPEAAEKLRAAHVVGAPGEFKPLILDAQQRLYLQRYWQYEHQLAEQISARLKTSAACDAALLAEGLRRFSPDHASSANQRRAAATAVEQNFTVITGGPGTGKTRTVVIVLALLIEQFAAGGKPPRIALAAPTGKAGARLKESIRKTSEELQLPESIRRALPADASTLHRLLGAIHQSPYFRHDAERPLAVDAVIVDEASMVDLALMAKLVDALPKHARLILLGDKDQLASVEAGYVLGDICAGCEAESAPLHGRVVELRTNYRFDAASGIHALSNLVNAGNADAALALLEERRHGDVVFARVPPAAGLAAALREHVLDGFSSCMREKDPVTALIAFAEFRILAALRRGPYGVENLNRLAEQILAEAGLIDPQTPFYAGRPVLIRQNDPQLRLFNGDSALLLPDTEAGGELRAFFLDPDGALRRVLPARLPAHETGFATTIHKSQGSEFHRVLLILPEKDHPVCTRELVYTGLTRARKSVEVWSREASLRSAITRRTVRTSGLPDAIAATARQAGG